MLAEKPAAFALASAAGEIPAASGRGAEIDRQASSQQRRVFILVAGMVFLLALMVASVTIGATGLGPLDVLGAIFAQVTGIRPEWLSETDAMIIWQLRLPRAVLAVVAGAGLSVSGVLLQGLLRNPLVSPFTLGISPAAAFGASIALVLSGSAGGASQIVIVLSALASALICAAFVLGIAATKQMAPIVVILIGVALTQLFEALTAAMQYIADEATLASIVRWTFGSVNAAEWTQTVAIAAVLVAVLPFLLLKATELNAIAFAGDDAARSLGVNVSAIRLAMASIAVVVSAVIVSVIGFVSLVGPHIARMIIGSDHRFLIPFSLIAGAALLIVADIVGRVILAPVVVPVGIVIAFVGAPLFINLILTRRNNLS